MHYSVILLPGDGIGPEVTAAAEKVMQHMAAHAGITISTTNALIGGCAWEAQGVALSDDTLQLCKQADAVFLGAVGGKKWDSLEHAHKPETALLKLRKELALYANIRPAKALKSFMASSALKEEVLAGTDFVVLRELTGGIYFGQPRAIEKNRAFNTMVYEKYEVERIAHKAFQIAQKRKQKVTSVDKANVLEVSRFWRAVVEEVAQSYPDVQLEHMYVDNAAMQVVRSPKQFDVILTSNLFGDIISDISGMITGSLGMLPSASIGQEHTLYEPVHGSAPDIAGEDRANPIAAILSVAMMFGHSFNLPQMEQIIESAVEEVLSQGFHSEDIALESSKIVSTSEMAQLIIASCDRILQKQTQSNASNASI